MAEKPDQGVTGLEEPFEALTTNSTPQQGHGSTPEKAVEDQSPAKAEKRAEDRTAYIYGIQIPFQCTDDLMIVKVGYSADPGNRLGDIRSALNSLTDEQEFSFMSDYVNLKNKTAKEIIERAKKERGHLLFLVQIKIPQSTTPRKYGEVVEKAVRDVVASFPLDSAFLDDFKSKLTKEQQKCVDSIVGRTEWVMAKASIMNVLQQAFRDSELDGMWESKEHLVDKVKSFIQPAAETYYTVSFKIKGMKDMFTRKYPIPTKDTEVKKKLFT